MTDRLIDFELERMIKEANELRELCEMESAHIKHSLTELYNKRRELRGLRKEIHAFIKKYEIEDFEEERICHKCEEQYAYDGSKDVSEWCNKCQPG